MAGKFVSIEEAARILGVSVEEVNRLVDRKKLFPTRDGAGYKFKADEVQRVADSVGDDSSRSGSLSLDLDIGSPAAGDLALGDAIDLGGEPAGDAGSQTIVRGGPAAGGSDLSGLALGGDDDDDTATDSEDLVLESHVGASSPSLARHAPGGGSAVGGTSGGDDQLALDIGPLEIGSGAPPRSQAAGSIAGLSGPGGSGSGFSAPLDGGLSLEGTGIGTSGIDLDLGPAPGASNAGASGVGGGSLGGGSLAGDAFDLGDGAGDEDSASVVIATEESGDSSFFANAAEDSASVAFDDSSSAIDMGASDGMLDVQIHDLPADMTFSGWQIAGLTCCALVLLAGGFVMYDLVWTIRSPQATPYSAILLDAMSNAFGWRR